MIIVYVCGGNCSVNEGTVSMEESLVSTDGGRYDVDVSRRERTAVYWEEAPSTVRRCSWFFKGSLETRYTPYDEEMAEKLEEEYQKTILLRSANISFQFPLPLCHLFIFIDDICLFPL